MKKPKGWLEKKDYDFIYSRVPRLCVDLVVRVGKGIVLTYRKIEPWKNNWHTPGGTVFKGESLEKAAKRIAKSEIGVNVKLERVLGAMEFPRERRDGIKFHSVSVVFEAMPLDKNFTGGWQADKIKVFEKIPKNTISIQANFLKDKKILK